MRPRAAPARPRRQRREGRPTTTRSSRPRSAHDLHGLHARRAADLRPRRAPLPRRVLPAGPLRPHDGGHARSRSERFRTRGKITLEAGWRGVYGLEAERPARQDEDDAEGGELPALEQGQAVTCVEAESEREGDEAAAALHGGDAALRDGDGRQADRRRGAARGDEGARPRHAGDARRDDRDADPPRVHRARRQGPAGDARRACR